MKNALKRRFFCAYTPTFKEFCSRYARYVYLQYEK